MPDTKYICLACDKPLKGTQHWAATLDGQQGLVGPDCFKKIKAAGKKGYLPKAGGPRLWEVIFADS